MTDTAEPLPIAKGTQMVYMLPGMANRHGLIAGATGTGKTTTLRVLAENFSSIGVPVFMADIKGDLSGMTNPGGDNAKVVERAAELGLPGVLPKGYPVTFWDVYGVSGLPVRTTISEMGPLLLGRILDLSDIQTDVLTALFRYADDNGLLLLDLKDVRLGAVHQEQALGTIGGNLAAEFAADAAAGAGHQHHPILQDQTDVFGFQLHSLPPEQVLDLDIP